MTLKLRSQYLHTYLATLKEKLWLISMLYKIQYAKTTYILEELSILKAKLCCDDVT